MLKTQIAAADVNYYFGAAVPNKTLATAANSSSTTTNQKLGHFTLPRPEQPCAHFKYSGCWLGPGSCAAHGARRSSDDVLQL